MHYLQHQKKHQAIFTILSVLIAQGPCCGRRLTPFKRLWVFTFTCLYCARAKNFSLYEYSLPLKEQLSTNFQSMYILPLSSQFCASSLRRGHSLRWKRAGDEGQCPFPLFACDIHGFTRSYCAEAMNFYLKIYSSRIFLIDGAITSISVYANYQARLVPCCISLSIITLYIILSMIMRHGSSLNQQKSLN